MQISRNRIRNLFCDRRSGRKMEKRHVAIVLAAGSGSRMKSDVPKQYLKLNGKEVLYYSLKAFEESFVSEVILVTGEGWQEFCRTEITEKYHLI